MQRGVLLRLVLVLLVLAGCAALAINKKPVLGLDLKGGTQFLLETSDGPTAEANASNTDKVVNVLRQRIDTLGVSETNIYRSGSNRIIAEIPGEKPTKQQTDILTKAAQLTVREVTGPGTYQEYLAQQAEKDEPGADGTATPKPSAPATTTPAATPTAPTVTKPTGSATAPATETASAAATETPSAPASTPAGDGKQGTGETTESLVLPVLSNGVDLTPEELPGAEFVTVGPAKIVGDEIKSARAEQPQNSPSWVVNIEFNGGAGDVWQKVTADAACARDQGDNFASRTAIVLDNKIITAPVPESGSVQCGVGIAGGQTSITGQESPEEAKSLAMLIEGGALPLNIQELDRSYVGPSLGDDAIKASWQAGIIGLILTALFITFAYRVVGFTATLALSTYALLSYAMLVGLGATLTLPGLAGFVLAIGLAIDANVLVFERAREEYLANPGAGLRRALATGFNKAWSAILDSNVTTLLAAGLLFFLGSQMIKGFGVTLVIGTIASMVSALIVARVFTNVALSLRSVNKRPRISGIAHQSKVRQWLEGSSINIMKHRGKWLAVSLIALVLAGSGVFIKGLNLGVEFTGGRQLEYSTTQKVDIDDAREAVTDVLSSATVQEASNDKISVRTGKITDAQATEIEEAIAEIGGGATMETNQSVSGTLGSELARNALIAFGVAFLAQLAYLAFRFKWTFGLAAVLAMAHDVFIVLGIFAWLGRPIDGIFLAAAMTIIGLSVNDTVVVFDRIRERWRNAPKGANFSDEANAACLETVPRTVNTGLGAMFILAALAILGGDSLQDFALALLIGLIVGTYSSTFSATPLVTYLQQKWPFGQEQRVKVARDEGDSGAVV